MWHYQELRSDELREDAVAETTPTSKSTTQSPVNSSTNKTSSSSRAIYDSDAVIPSPQPVFFEKPRRASPKNSNFHPVFEQDGFHGAVNKASVANAKRCRGSVPTFEVPVDASKSRLRYMSVQCGNELEPFKNESFVSSTIDWVNATSEYPEGEEESESNLDSFDLKTDELESNSPRGSNEYFIDDSMANDLLERSIMNEAVHRNEPVELNLPLNRQNSDEGYSSTERLSIISTFHPPQDSNVTIWRCWKYLYGSWSYHIIGMIGAMASG